MVNRRLLSAPIVLIGIVLLAGCGGQDSGTTELETTEAPSDDTSPARTIEQYDSAVWKADGIIEEAEYQLFRKEGGFELYYAADDTYAYFALQAGTTGWLAIGLAPTSRMQDADMILGTVNDGEAVISDQFSTGIYGPHRPDTELGGTDDIVESGGREANGSTTIEFKRLLTTGDAFDYTITGDPFGVILAYGSSDDIANKHVFRAGTILGD